MFVLFSRVWRKGGRSRAEEVSSTMSLQSMSMNTSLKNAMIFVAVEEDSTELDDASLKATSVASSASSTTTFNNSNRNESRGKIVQRASNRSSRTTSVPYQRTQKCCSSNNNNDNKRRNNPGHEEEMRGRSVSSRSTTTTTTDNGDAVVSSTSSNQWRTDPVEPVETGGSQQDTECCSSSEGSSSRKSSCSRYSGPADNRPKREKDPEILSRRQKQIDYGKNTIGYDNYIRTVPRHERKFDDPRTPDKTRVYSRRAFDGLIKEWRLKLHKYDNA